MTCKQTAEFQSGELFIRPVTLPKVGNRIGGHRHDFAHTMIVLHGSVRVTLTDAEGVATVCDLDPDDYLIVPAEALPAATQAAINGAALYGTDSANVVGFVAFTTTTGESIVARMKP